MTTANLRLANAETVTLFSTSDGLVPVSTSSMGGIYGGGYEVKYP